MICVSWTILEFIDRRWLGANPYENKKKTQPNKFQLRFSNIHSHSERNSTEVFKHSLAWSSAQPNKFQNLKGRILFLSVPEIGHCLKRTSSVAFESDSFSTEKRWAGQGNPYPIGENDSGIMQTFRGRMPLHPRLCSSEFQAAQLEIGEG